MVNQFNEREMLDLIYRACLVAVGAGFPHLPLSAIIDPPHPWFDAAFARQIVLHLMIARFDIPKRRVDVDLRRSREAIHRAMRVVDERLDSPEFEAHYRKMAAHAEELLAHPERLEEAA